MIVGLLVEQLLRILGLMLHSIQQLVQLIFESLVFNLCEILLILQSLSGLADQVLVVEKVTSQFLVDGLSLIEAALDEG